MYWLAGGMCNRGPSSMRMKDSPPKGEEVILLVRLLPHPYIAHHWVFNYCIAVTSEPAASTHLVAWNMTSTLKADFILFLRSRQCWNHYFLFWFECFSNFMKESSSLLKGSMFSPQNYRDFRFYGLRLLNRKVGKCVEPQNCKCL